MGDMWSTFNYFLNYNFNYDGITFSFYNVLWADVILALIGMALVRLLLFWAAHLGLMPDFSDLGL